MKCKKLSNFIKTKKKVKKSAKSFLTSLTVGSGVTGLTGTHVAVDVVVAHSTVLARIARTLIDVWQRKKKRYHHHHES
jgi:hypothetical protein